MATKTLITVEEFARMTTPETEDFELVEGELLPLPSANFQHAIIRQNVEYFLRVYFSQKKIGKTVAEVDCRVGADTVRRPDVSVFLSKRLQELDPKRVPLVFAPDIAVEILSPSETAIDVHRKVRDYLAGGSTEVWIIDHENSEVFVHSKSGIRLLAVTDTLESPLLPGFSAPVRELLAGF